MDVAKEIFMPKLSSTMTVGTLLEWFKEEGDTVEVGEPLFEIMTDKINIEVEAYEEGTLLKKYYDSDAEIPVNAVIGYIGEPNEQVPDTPPSVVETDATDNGQDTVADHKTEEKDNGQQVSGDQGGKVRATPAARKAAQDHGVDLQTVQGSGPKGRIHRDDVIAVAESSSAQVKATPLAQKIAADKQIDLGAVKGTGVQGKIYKDDVLQHHDKMAVDVSEDKRIKVSGIRKVIAERMVQSAFTAPHVTLTSEVDMSQSVQLRRQLLPVIEKLTGYRLSYTELIVKVVAHALKRHPQMNASLEGDVIVLKEAVNVGLAVSVDDGLIVPVVKDVDKRGLADLTTACKQLAQAARENQLKPEHFTGGTFTVSNLGMYAIDSFTPIINQPESAILGVGRINEKPVGVDGVIELRPMMTLSLSFDHRVIDGAPAADFLTDVKNMLENPFELLI